MKTISTHGRTQDFCKDVIPVEVALGLDLLQSRDHAGDCNELPRPWCQGGTREKSWHSIQIWVVDGRLASGHRYWGCTN